MRSLVAEETFWLGRCRDILCIFQCRATKYREFNLIAWYVHIGGGL